MRDPIDYYTNNLVPIVIEQSARGERQIRFQQPLKFQERFVIEHDGVKIV